MATFLKDPSAALDYAVDWSAWLGTDTIATSTWVAETGLTVDSDTIDAGRTTVWLSGGEVGQTYTVTNSIVTAAGRRDDRTLRVMVLQR